MENQKLTNKENMSEVQNQIEMFELAIANNQNKALVNIASVPQRSPFRYPGGKTWLVPTIRKWLKQSTDSKVLVEPFVGGGIVGLTAAFENLVDKVYMIEKDEEVAAVWQIILSQQNNKFADFIYNYELTLENINQDLGKKNKTLFEQAFCTILKNRVFHGGIITKGSGLIKSGENGKGIHSRWYPKTLRDRITAIGYFRDKIDFKLGDAFETIFSLKSNKNYYFFIDPPYTIAGKRLYTHFDVDHEKLFHYTSQIKGKYMLTYDDTEEIRGLATKYKLEFRTIPMKTTHHLQKNELIISDNFNWW